MLPLLLEKIRISRHTSSRPTRPSPALPAHIWLLEEPLNPGHLKMGRFLALSVGNQCPGAAGGLRKMPRGQLGSARRALAPSFGKPEFHIIFLLPASSGENWGPPPLQSPTGGRRQGWDRPSHGTRGIFQRKDWDKSVFSADDHWTEASVVKAAQRLLLAVASWKSSRTFPHQLLPKAVLCAAIYWCTSTELV